MTVSLASLPILSGLLALVAGLVLGVAHFATLRKVTDLYLGGTAPGRALALQLARLAVLGGFLTVLALTGAAPLLAGVVGVLIGRAIVLRRARGRV